MISPSLLSIVRCPDCAGDLASESAGVRCAGCGRAFSARGGYLDLRPRQAFNEQTKYLDHALHADARHETVAPPLLGSKVRFDRLRAFLRPGPGDHILDLGCGSGRTLVWNAASGAALTGIDIAPYFAPEALDRCDLVLGDLRRLPIRDEAFTKAWSIDVLEHLSRPALADVLAEANRVLTRDGVLFVYTHVRRNGWLGGVVRLVNRLARGFERMGLLDLRQERLRKSDHVNPLADHDELARVVADSGFRIERITYYTPIIGAFVENILVRVAEQTLARRAATATGRRAGVARSAAADAAATTHAGGTTSGAVGGRGDEARRQARQGAQAHLRRGGWVYAGARAASALMTLDVLLFGRVRSGPFFALLRKTGAPRTRA